MNALFRLPLVWALYFLLWLVFVFQVTAAELIAGSVAAALATLGTEIIVRCEPLCFHPKVRWLSQSCRLPAMIAKDLWTLSRDLGQLILRKPSQSELVSTSLVTDPEECKAGAQRALAVLFVSMSPNSVVVGLNRESDQMLVHNLRPAPIPPLVRKLQE